MREKGIKRKIAAAMKKVEREMNMHGGSKYARAFASEGYNGGYYHALNDVLLALDGNTPNRNYWWEQTEQAPTATATATATPTETVAP